MLLREYLWLWQPYWTIQPQPWLLWFCSSWITVYSTWMVSNLLSWKVGGYSWALDFLCADFLPHASSSSPPPLLLAPCGYVWDFSSPSCPPHPPHHCWRYLVWLLFLQSVAFTVVFLLAEKHQHGKICFSYLIERECGKGRGFVNLGISISPGCLYPFWICLSLNLGVLVRFQNFVYS